MKSTEKGIESLFSFFEESEQSIYQTPRELIPQFNDDSCVAACVRMLLADFGIDAAESYLASALEISNGSLLSKAPQILEDFGLPQKYQWRKNLTLADLSVALQTGSAIVSVKRRGAIFGHALVVDAIFNDEIRLRDPLPKNQGKSYAVAVEKFSEVFFRNGDAGFGVINVK